jgi:5'-3' exonuclease
MGAYSMRLLCDLDIVLYRCLHATKEQGFYAGIRAADNTVDRILDRFDYPSDTSLVLSGPGNFRKDFCSTYKSNRKPESRPPYLFEAKEYFKKYWGALESRGEEADDLIAQMINDNCVVATLDKDYKQLGVPLYNFVKNELIEVSNPEYWFWLQMLVGDQADSIEGLTNPTKLHHKQPPNFTEATAHEVLKDKSPEEMKQLVQGLYQQIHGDAWFEKYDTTARLLFLRRKDAQEYYEIF